MSHKITTSAGKSAITILSKVLLDEESSSGLYETLANAVKDEKIREQLINMAQSERRHSQIISDILLNITGSESPVHSILVSELTEHLRAEKTAIRKYEQLLKLNLGEANREKLTQIIGESQHHYEQLRIILNLLKSQPEFKGN
jgi:rubrerythrin